MTHVPYDNPRRVTSAEATKREIARLAQAWGRATQRRDRASAAYLWGRRGRAIAILDAQQGTRTHRSGMM